jgi:CRISPR/Cas system CSM-associated protein Csm2 small subunit
MVEYTYTEEKTYAAKTAMVDAAISILRLDSANSNNELKRKATEYLKLVLDEAIEDMSDDGEPEEEMQN